MGKPLQLTLLRVINPCHLHDPNGMPKPDDTTKTLYKHGGSLCYIPPCLSVDDLVEQDEQFLRQSDVERTTLLSDMSSFPSYPLDPIGGPRLPFTSWEDISRLFTEHLEVRRFLQLSSSKRSSTWRERRKHAPFSEAVPPVWDLDALYLRHSDERAYCERLRRLKVDSSLTSVYLDLVCLDSPLVPFRGSNPQHRVEVNRSRFPGTWDLIDPSGSDICLDSAWRLRTASLEGGTGELGRMLG
jgi:hypothetical protein